MGSEFNPSKPHYDITMSKRTRKALFKEKLPDFKGNNEDENGEEKRKKQFPEDADERGDVTECRSSLGERFTEEDKQLQLVVKHHEKALDGVSLKKMVSRCAKMWGHLVKIKGDKNMGSRKKRVLHLTM